MPNALRERPDAGKAGHQSEPLYHYHFLRQLTTGVTVPEWTAVMMLTGSASTAAPGYMQTIFRVQSAGVLDGKQKERCYVFDFAPDRALNVLSEVNRVTKRGKTNEEEYRKALGEFLNFCPGLPWTVRK